MKMRFLMAGAMLAGCLVVAGCGDDSTNSNTGAGTTNGADSSSLLTAPVDYLGAVGKAQQTAIKTVDTATLKQAIQMFQVEHDRFPKDLNELVEAKVLPRIPDLPKGMKYVYDPNNGTLVVVKQ